MENEKKNARRLRDRCVNGKVRAFLVHHFPLTGASQPISFDKNINIFLFRVLFPGSHGSPLTVRPDQVG